MASYYDLPVIECDDTTPTIFLAAAKAGYGLPKYRVGESPDSPAYDWERRVAWVKANKHSRPHPILERIGTFQYEGQNFDVASGEPLEGQHD